MSIEPDAVTVRETEAAELTLEERLSKANEEVSAILNKYDVNIAVQNVPVIVPVKTEQTTDLKA